MDIILNDGTMITNAKISDIEEMMAKGIIGNSGTMATGTTELSETHGWSWESEQSDMQKMLDACNTMCKDNDMIPPQNYTDFDGTNYSAPGIEIVKSLMDNNRIVNGPTASDAFPPKINFPTVEFTSIPTSGNITDNSIETSATAKSANQYSLDELTESLMSRAGRNSFDPEENTKEDYKKYVDGLKQRKNW